MLAQRAQGLLQRPHHVRLLSRLRGRAPNRNGQVRVISPKPAAANLTLKQLVACIEYTDAASTDRNPTVKFRPAFRAKMRVSATEMHDSGTARAARTASTAAEALR